MLDDRPTQVGLCEEVAPLWLQFQSTWKGKGLLFAVLLFVLAIIGYLFGRSSLGSNQDAAADPKPPLKECVIMLSEPQFCPDGD